MISFIMEGNLEERLASSMISFTKKHIIGYSIKNYPSEEKPKNTIIEIELTDYRLQKNGTPIFRHFVVMQGSQMVSQSTSFVGDDLVYRNLYKKFIEHMGESGIRLTNDFEETWAARPERYPL